MIAKLSGPMLPPKSGNPPLQIMVLLHGYGSDGNDLIGLAPHFQALLPDALFVAPNAHEACRDLASGYQWFPVDYERRVQSWTSGPPLARPVIVQFLNDLWAQTGLTAADTILAGFSQGAMMALHAGLSLEAPLKAIIAFSGGFPAPEGFGPLSPKPPVCLVHGDLDTVVDTSLSAIAERELAAAGIPVRHYVSPGTAHGISPDGLAFAQNFIAEVAAA